MLCKSPYMAGALPFGCGQCLPCRINRRRQWAARQYMESLTHDENAFVTLTYNGECFPRDGSLQPSDLSGFIKRLRARLEPVRFRFFGVGEYGDGADQRPHYHLSLFGVSGRTSVLGPSRVQHFGVSEAVSKAWGKGFTDVQEFSPATAQYVCGYVTKKMTFKGDERLNGRHPEFARMSLRPAIGTEAMKVVAAQLAGSGFIDSLEDVPHVLKVGKRSLPLGRTMLRKLREAIGFTQGYMDYVKGKVSHEKSLELLAVFAANESGEEIPTFRKSYQKEVATRILQLEARSKIFEQKRKL